jgi:hypothetical protein
MSVPEENTASSWSQLLLDRPSLQSRAARGSLPTSDIRDFNLRRGFRMRVLMRFSCCCCVGERPQHRTYLYSWRGNLLLLFGLRNKYFWCMVPRLLSGTPTAKLGKFRLENSHSNRLRSVVVTKPVPRLLIYRCDKPSCT